MKNNAVEVLSHFDKLGCKDFYIISFSENSKLGAKRLRITGCDNLVERKTFFSLEMHKNDFLIKFTENHSNKEVITNFNISPELFQTLLEKLNSLDEMRSRKISSMSYSYGKNRSAHRFLQ